jgi:hypothetical protein
MASKLTCPVPWPWSNTTRQSAAAAATAVVTVSRYFADVNITRAPESRSSVSTCVAL